MFNNYLYNPDHYEKQQIDDIIAFNKEDLGYFGFETKGKSEEGTNILEPVKGFKDRMLPNQKKHFTII